MTLLQTLARAAVLAAATALATPASAQACPSRPLKFVVPFPAGSATDVVARTVAQGMGEAMGQPVAVENKAGANGILGRQGDTG